MENQSSIYVGTYRKYNEGSLYGKWLTLSEYNSKDEFITECLSIHKSEEDPELMFQDWENIPSKFITESSIDKSFWDYLSITSELSSDDLEAFELWLSNDSSIEINEDTLDSFKDLYCGSFSNGLEDYADQLIDEGCLGDIPSHLLPYIDSKRYSNDLESSGDYWESGSHVFRSR